MVTTEDSTTVLGLSIGSKKLRQFALGEVRAGMELSQLNVGRVSITDLVNVFFPQARILDAMIDVDRSYVYDVRRSMLFAPDETPSQSEVLQAVLERVEKLAIEMGLINFANQSAVKKVKDLVESLVDKEVVVVVE